MVVHYNKGRGTRMVVSGSVLTVLYLFLLSRGYSKPWLLIPCLLIVVSGFLYLRRPYFELRKKELVVFNLLGYEAKRYVFSSLKDFTIVNNRVYLQQGAKRRRVWVSRMVAAKQEWQRFADLISGQELMHELHDV